MWLVSNNVNVVSVEEHKWGWFEMTWILLAWNDKWILFSLEEHIEMACLK